MRASLNKYVVAILGVGLLALALPAHAETTFQKTHPRRAQANSRLDNQNKRIKQGEKSGKLSKGQGKQLHAEHHAIRQEERSDAAAHGGHITKGEQRHINHQENAESNQIYNEKH